MRGGRKPDRHGVPAPGSRPSVAHLLSGPDAMLERVIPRSFWADVIVRGRQPG
jgi:hypothetical protein